jgi:hypothetical protein
MNEMVNKCYSCDFHRQECTFTRSASVGATATVTATATTVQPKKRKLDDADVVVVESVKRYDIPC